MKKITKNALLVLLFSLFTFHFSFVTCSSKKSEAEKATEPDKAFESPTKAEITERYLFEQNFVENDISLVYIDRELDPITPYDSYVPNIGFSVGKRVIYNGTIKLLDEPIPESALAVLNKEELRILRNSIYAKYGRTFESNDLQAHFQLFDWYWPNSSNVETRLTDLDKTNIERIQVFENARPNSNLKENDFANEYWGQLPLGIGSGCPEIYFNDTHTIEWYGWREDNFKGSYKIENGFFVVFVTEQYVKADHTPTSEYFLSNNWHWPDGVTYSDGTVVYKEPIKMVFPVGDVFFTYHYERYYYEGQQLGSNVWWLRDNEQYNPADVYIRGATDEFISQFDSFYRYDDNYNSGERIAIWAGWGNPLKEFHFVSLNYNHETGTWASADTLYSIDELQPEKALLLNTYIAEGIPTRGITFRDENNRLRFFTINKNEKSKDKYYMRPSYNDWLKINNSEYNLKEIPIRAFG